MGLMPKADVLLFNILFVRFRLLYVVYFCKYCDCGLPKRKIDNQIGLSKLKQVLVLLNNPTTFLFHPLSHSPRRLFPNSSLLKPSVPPSTHPSLGNIVSCFTEKRQGIKRKCLSAYNIYSATSIMPVYYAFQFMNKLSSLLHFYLSTGCHLCFFKDRTAKILPSALCIIISPT